MSLGLAEPICHYPEPVLLSQIGEAACFCRQDRSDDDASWIIQNAFTVLSMQAGFALLEAGSVTDLNVVNIMIKNMSELGAGGALYFLFGYAFLYGGKEEDHSAFMAGAGNYALVGLTDHTNFLFSFSFAMSTATIISGAVAERIDFWAYLSLSCFYTNFVYPVAAYWTWGPKGWLKVLGMMDYAGGGCVHVIGGTGALVAAMWIGPRLDRFTENALRLEMNDPASVMWGTFVLWLGWFGFTSGSSLGFSGADGVGAVQVAINTAISGAFGLLSGLIYSYFSNHGHVRVEAIATSLLSALVTITPGCAYVQPWEAAIMGFTGALVGTASCKGVDQVAFRLQLDDPVQAIGVHFMSGIWGMLCVGLFANVDYCHGATHLVGLFHGGGAKLLGLQLLGIICMIAWSAACCLIALTLMHYCPLYNSIRVSEEDERLGLDFVEHGVYNRKREMMERVEELASVMRDLDLIDVPEENQKEAMEQLQSVTRGDTLHGTQQRGSQEDWHLETLPERGESTAGGERAAVARMEVTRLASGGAPDDVRVSVDVQQLPPAHNGGIDGTEHSAATGASDIDRTAHSAMTRSSHESNGSNGSGGRFGFRAKKQRAPLRRMVTSRYANPKVQQAIQKAQGSGVGWGGSQGSGSHENGSLDGLPEDREWNAETDQQRANRARAPHDRARRHSCEPVTAMTGFAHNVGAEEERKREEEERGTRRREWAEKEKALARKWEELEGGMSAKEKGMMALFREEIGMLRERLAEAEGRPKPGMPGVAKAENEPKKKLKERAMSMLALRVARDQNRERLVEEVIRKDRRKSDCQVPVEPQALSPPSPEGRASRSPAAGISPEHFRMKATVTAEDPLPNLNGHNGIHVSSIPTASQTRSWSVDVPLHMLQGLQQDGGKWTQAGDHRGGDGKVPPPSDVDRSGSGDQTKRTPSDPQHHLRTPRHEHEQQRPRPLSTSDWAALRRMGSGRLMPAGIGGGLSAL